MQRSRGIRHAGTVADWDVHHSDTLHIVWKGDCNSRSGSFCDIGESLALMKWSRRRKSPVGAEALVGRTAVVATPTQARIAGELWQVSSDTPLLPGTEVEVVGVEGLTLLVRAS